MADQIHVRLINLRRGDERFKHGMRPLGGAIGWQQTEPCGDAVNMGIDWEGRLSTGKEQNTGDRLRPHTGKLSQEGAGCRHRQLYQEVQT
jgi:hypothetical protein